MEGSPLRFATIAFVWVWIWILARTPFRDTTDAQPHPRQQVFYGCWARESAALHQYFDAALQECARVSDAPAAERGYTLLAASSCEMLFSVENSGKDHLSPAPHDVSEVPCDAIAIRSRFIKPVGSKFQCSAWHLAHQWRKALDTDRIEVFGGLLSSRGWGMRRG